MKKLSVKQRNRLIGMAIILAVLIASAILYVRIGQPMTELVKDTDRLRAWVAEKGWSSRLIYMAMVCLQVLAAVIPGEPLEMAAGFAFGPIEGALICIGGIALGSMIVFGLVRLFGMKLVEMFFSREKIDSLKIMRNPKKVFLVTAALMILPGTPKDLLTYCAGLTKISWAAWLLISTVGRIPSVITSTWGGHAIAEGNYVGAAVIFLVTSLLCGAGLYVYARFRTDKIEKKIK
ncbi:MAG: TVP38/TMEM64 family protein [Clostridia bacterium]|nr:TVP38/TMEM64 family protein [Clostridia bacterium]